MRLAFDAMDVQFGNIKTPESATTDSFTIFNLKAL